MLDLVRNGTTAASSGQWCFVLLGIVVEIYGNEDTDLFLNKPEQIAREVVLEAAELLYLVDPEFPQLFQLHATDNLLNSIPHTMEVDLALQDSEAQKRECYSYDHRRDSRRLQALILDRKNGYNLKGKRDWKARRWEKIFQKGEGGFIVEHNPRNYDARLPTHAGETEFEARSLQQSRNSAWMSDLKLMSARENAGILEEPRQSGLQRQKNAIKTRQKKCWNPDVKQMNAGKNLTHREQMQRESICIYSSDENENISDFYHWPIFMKSLNQSQHCRKSFPMHTLEEFIQKRAYSHQNRREDIGSFSVEKSCSMPLHKLHSQAPLYLKKPTFIHQQTKRKKKATVKRSEKEVFTSMDTNQRLLRNCIGAKHISSTAMKKVADNNIQSSGLGRHGCGIPRHCSEIQKDKGRKFMAIARRSFSCGFPVSSRRQAWKLISGCRCSLGVESSLPNSISEMSLSSIHSEIEISPLLTDAECHPGYTDAALHSSMDLSESLPQCIDGEPKLNGSGDFQSDKSGVESATKSTLWKGKAQVKNFEGHRSLSQKYRPKSFKELVGQSMIAQLLSNAVSKGKIAPVYLFQGPPGTGKTSAARIFAAALNCLSTDELKPCSVCKDCITFNSGKNSDFREVDAACNTEIENMKALLAHVFIPPSSSRYKVFIIDDCHMLTPEVWNEFLRSVEEPPTYLVFILITTEPGQLPHAAVSRCQRFIFPKIRESEILTRIQKLSLKEEISIDADALRLIATRSDGSLRDAEDILDQSSLLGQKVTVPMVCELVGLIPNEKLIRLLELAFSADTVSTVKCIKELTASGVEPLALASQLATFIADMLAGNGMFGKYNKTKGLLSRHLLSMDELEGLRQALKILSEAQKQLKVCNDRTTWLIASLLQFPPCDFSFLSMNRTSFIDTTESESVELKNEIGIQQCKEEQTREQSWLQQEVVPANNADSEHAEAMKKETNILSDCLQSYSSNFSGSINNKWPWSVVNAEDRTSDDARRSLFSLDYCANISEAGTRENCLMNTSKMDNVWKKVLEGVCSNVLRQLLCEEAKLVSLSVSEAFAIAHLEFQHPEDKLKAERARISISNALQVALGCPVQVNLSLAPLQGPAMTDLWDPPASLEKSVSYPKQNAKTPILESEGKFWTPILPMNRQAQSADSFRKTLRSIKPGGCMLNSQVYNAESKTSKADDIGIMSARDASIWNNSYVNSRTYATKKGGHLANPLGRKYSVTGTQTGSDHILLQRYLDVRQQSVKGKALENESTFPVETSPFSLAVVIQQADGSIDGYSQDLLYDDVNGSLKGKIKRGDTEKNDDSDHTNLNNVTNHGHTGFLCWKSTILKEKKGTRLEPVLLIEPGMSSTQPS